MHAFSVCSSGSDVSLVVSGLRQYIYIYIIYIYPGTSYIYTGIFCFHVFLFQEMLFAMLYKPLHV